MDLNEIKELINLLEKSSLRKIHLKSGSDELVLEKQSETLPLATVPPEFAMKKQEKKTEQKKEKFEEEEGYFVTSPIVGTFHSSQAPDRPPFVKVGDRVNESTVVCIIEAMKVMNEVKASQSGTIVEILCENAQPVEFGTKLFRIQ